MKMLRSISFIVLLFAAFFISTLSAHADLFNRGTDINGNRLIYDSDFDITWYDYTKSYDTWQNQMNWADALSVTFGSNTYTDWHLPITFDQNCSGYNCTNSEMGHLYYTELGNSVGGPLNSTGDFQNLQMEDYWSGTEYSPNPDVAWAFGFWDGYQLNTVTKGHHLTAIAVRSGDVPQLEIPPTVVPEPISSILFVTGGTLLAGRRLLRRRHNKSLQ